ncbi:FliH/SctL family protein [Sphingorhabdus sp.]|uniref:FliH/SctL family protein n=2 Tax=Sphingorhabdus sp. TaxID=1902408 RepID=UPI0032B7FFCD
MSEAGFVPLVETSTETPDAFQPWAELLAHAKSAPVDEFERGLAEGQALAEAAFSEERRRLQALVAAADALQPIEPEKLRDLVCTTVERLVREIVGATPVDPELLRRQVGEAIQIAETVGSDAVLRLAPDDVALFDGFELGLPIIADTQLTPGTLRLETQTGAVEHGRAVQLEALRMQLGVAENGR